MFWDFIYRDRIVISPPVTLIPNLQRTLLNSSSDTVVCLLLSGSDPKVYLFFFRVILRPLSFSARVSGDLFTF